MGDLLKQQSPAPVKLIVLDYDYTVHDWEAEPSVCDAFFESMSIYQAMGGLFAINSGRTLTQMRDGLGDYIDQLQPDYLLTTEREVWRPNDDHTDWVEYGDWNQRCRDAHTALAKASAELMTALAERLKHQHAGTRLLWEEQVLQGLVASHAAEMTEICALLEEHISGAEHVPLSYQRNDIYLRFCHREYHKGAALGELTRLLGLHATEVFAMGDNHNDLSMLDPNLAAYLACPGNSIQEVRNTIRERGGYVARQRCSLGVCEALNFYRVPGWTGATAPYVTV